MALKTPDLSLLSPWHLSFSRQSDKLDTFSLYLLLDLKSTLGWKSGIFGCYLYSDSEGQVPSVKYQGYDRDQTQASDIQIICHGFSPRPSHHFIIVSAPRLLPGWTLQILVPIANRAIRELLSWRLVLTAERFCGFNNWRFLDWKENPLIFYSHSREHTSTLNSN